VFWWRSG